MFYSLETLRQEYKQYFANDGVTRRPSSFLFNFNFD